MECYSVKKSPSDSQNSSVPDHACICQKIRETGQKCAFPQGEATVSSRSHVGVSGETLGSEWKQMLCGFVVSQGLSSSEHTNCAHLHCMNKPFAIQKLQTPDSSSVSPFLPHFLSENRSDWCTQLLCLQSVSIPNKGAVSDCLNSAARQQPVEQHSSF